MLQVEAQNDLSRPSQHRAPLGVAFSEALLLYMVQLGLHSSTGHISVQYCMIQQERFFLR